MIIELEKTKDVAKNKYLNWMGATEDILEFLASVKLDNITKKFSDGYWMWSVPDEMILSNIETNIVEDYYSSVPLWWIKADYLSKKFKLPMAVTHVFSFLSPEELLELEQLPWNRLIKEECTFALRAAIVAEDRSLVRQLLSDPSFIDHEV
jgi:hypothetical protein